MFNNQIITNFVSTRILSVRLRVSSISSSSLSFVLIHPQYNEMIFYTFFPRFFLWAVYLFLIKHFYTFLLPTHENIFFLDLSSHLLVLTSKKIKYLLVIINTWHFPDEVLMTRRGRMGTIFSPRHTLPPNTTCTYFFHGIPTDLVWISFASYHLQILQPSSNDNATVARVSTRKITWKFLGRITINIT